MTDSPFPPPSDPHQQDPSDSNNFDETENSRIVSKGSSGPYNTRRRQNGAQFPSKRSSASSQSPSGIDPNESGTKSLSLSKSSPHMHRQREGREPKKIVNVKPSLAPIQELGDSFPDWSVLENELAAAKTLENAYFLDSSFLKALTIMSLWLNEDGPFFMPRREFRHRHCIFGLFWQPSAPNWEKSQYVVPPRLSGLLRWYLTRDNFIKQIGTQCEAPVRAIFQSELKRPPYATRSLLLKPNLLFLLTIDFGITIEHSKEVGNRLVDITSYLPEAYQTSLTARGWSLYIMNMVLAPTNQLIFRFDNERGYQPYFGSTLKSNLKGSILPEISPEAFDALVQKICDSPAMTKIEALPDLSLGPIRMQDMAHIKAKIDDFKANQLTQLKRDLSKAPPVSPPASVSSSYKKRKYGDMDDVASPSSSSMDSNKSGSTQMSPSQTRGEATIATRRLLRSSSRDHSSTSTASSSSTSQSSSSMHHHQLSHSSPSLIPDNNLSSSGTYKVSTSSGRFEVPLSLSPNLPRFSSSTPHDSDSRSSPLFIKRESHTHQSQQTADDASGTETLRNDRSSASDIDIMNSGNNSSKQHPPGMIPDQDPSSLPHAKRPRTQPDYYNVHGLPSSSNPPTAEDHSSRTVYTADTRNFQSYEFKILPALSHINVVAHVIFSKMRTLDHHQSRQLPTLGRLASILEVLGELQSDLEEINHSIDIATSMSDAVFQSAHLLPPPPGSLPIPNALDMSMTKPPATLDSPYFQMLSRVHLPAHQSSHSFDQRSMSQRQQQQHLQQRPFSMPLSDNFDQPSQQQPQQQQSQQQQQQQQTSAEMLPISSSSIDTSSSSHHLMATEESFSSQPVFSSFGPPITDSRHNSTEFASGMQFLVPSPSPILGMKSNTPYSNSPVNLNQPPSRQPSLSSSIDQFPMQPQSRFPSIPDPSHLLLRSPHDGSYQPLMEQHSHDYVKKPPPHHTYLQ